MPGLFPLPLAQAVGDSLRANSQQNAIMLAAVIAFLAAVGAYAIVILVKRRPGKMFHESEVSNELIIPPEVLAKLPMAPAAPTDPLEKHRRLVVIENAARDHACRLAQELGAAAEDAAASPAPPRSVWLLAGPGPLGAIVMAMARHLESLGLDATVQLLAFPDKLGSEAQAQRRILLASKLKLVESPTPRRLKHAARIVAGTDVELLSDARRADFDKIMQFAQEDSVPVEAFDAFADTYASPLPSAGDVVIPATAEVLSRENARTVDALAQQHFGVPGAALMENAGYWAAREAFFQIQALEKNANDPLNIVMLCGRGNNGGDGFVIARHLTAWGYPPEVVLLGQKDRTTDDAGLNLRMLEAAGIKVMPLFDDSQWPRVDELLGKAHLVVDAVLGTGMHGTVRGAAVEAIRRMNAARERGAFVLAVDCPSGIDCNTGEPLGACVTADLTVTFAANKTGFALGQGPALCGQIVVADIGLPREIYRKRLNPQG